METKLEYQTIKVWKKTLRLLRLISAYTGESIVSIVHRLAEAELQRVNKQ